MYIIIHTIVHTQGIYFAVSFLSIKNVLKFLYQGLMSVGHSDIGDIGSGDVISAWSFLTELIANPVSLDLNTSGTV